MNEFLRAKDIEEILQCGQSYAYKIIKQLNAELEKQNYLTFKGRVVASYFYKRCGGGIK